MLEFKKPAKETFGSVLEKHGGVYGKCQSIEISIVSEFLRASFWMEEWWVRIHET